MSGTNQPDLNQEILDELKSAIGEGINNIINVYLDDAPCNIREMRTALEHVDYATVTRMAHSLKSSSANLGALQVSQLSAELEREINNGLKDTAEINNRINDLEKAFEHVNTMLINYRR